jgi:hypothetical protein
MASEMELDMYLFLLPLAAMCCGCAERSSRFQLLVQPLAMKIRLVVPDRALTVGRVSGDLPVNESDACVDASDFVVNFVLHRRPPNSAATRFAAAVLGTSATYGRVPVTTGAAGASSPTSERDSAAVGCL